MEKCGNYCVIVVYILPWVRRGVAAGIPKNTKGTQPMELRAFGMM